MAINSALLLFNPIYNALGVPATLDMGTDGQFSLTVIDKTSGVEVSVGGDSAVNTIKPACAVRAAELAAKSLTAAGLRGAAITFNDNTWRIENRLPKPGPNGEADGEVYLTLIANA